MTLTTANLTLTYVLNRPFSAATLQIAANDGSWTWKYGMDNNLNGNFLGTIRSLDNVGVEDLNCTRNAGVYVHGEELHCAWSVASAAGWAIVDDTKAYILDNTSWFSENLRSTATTDIYLFGYGKDVAGAYKALISVSGRPALPPRAASGIWFTRWFDFDGVETAKVVDQYAAHGIPLDVWVYDMNWHQKPHWGGYAWDTRLFPSPSQAVRYLKSRGLTTLVNVHDDDGVYGDEPMRNALASYMGLPASQTGTIPFDGTSAAYLRGIDDVIFLKQILVDHLWIDWQQGGDISGLPGGALNPTIVLNHVRSTSPTRNRAGYGGKRSMILARYGGLGSQRYSLGFSGDVAGLTWTNLAYQPYYSSTAANVAFGQWSHDLEGPSDDLAMYVRWVQATAVSAVVRAHDRGMSAGGCALSSSCSIIFPWDVPPLYAEPIRAALRARAALIPYVASAWWRAYEDGMSVVAPLYAYWPNGGAESYLCGPTPGDENPLCAYVYGGSLVVAPVVVQGTVAGGLAAYATVSLPDNGVGWFDELEGQFRAGAFSVTRAWDLTETPVFAVAGSVVFAQRVPSGGDGVIGMSGALPSVLELRVAPQGSSQDVAVSVSTGTLREDDGVSDDYLNGAYVDTKVIVTRYARVPATMTVSVQVSQGPAAVPGFPVGRRYIVRLETPVVLQEATVALTEAECMAQPADVTCMWFDPLEIATYVLLPQLVGSSQVTLIAAQGMTFDDKASFGLRGIFRRAAIAKHSLDQVRTTPGSSDPNAHYLQQLAGLPAYLALIAGNATDFAAALSTAAGLVSGATTEVAQATSAKTDSFSQRAAAAMAITF